MRTSRLLAVPAALAAIALTAVSAAPPASAAKPAEPAESGVVQRFDPLETQGGHQVGPLMTEVGGDMLPILVVVGWDDAETYCAGGPPVFNGVEQVVVAPSGNVSIVVHNSNIPILVFDVSSADNEEDFFEKCAAGEILPLATGTATQRPIIHQTESAANVKAKTRGVVTDATGQRWTMQAFTKFRVDFGAQELQVLNEWVKLTAL
jgi:hypothetical protein